MSVPATENEFRVLDPLDFIKHNPNMYAGSTYSPIHLFKEVVDNVIDLLLENNVKNIVIDIIKPGRFLVIDDGPGFPRVQVKLPDGTFEDSIVASLTRPHSGSKFDSKAVQHGQNGVGTLVVNALSKFVSIAVRNKLDTKTVYLYSFINSKFVEQKLIPNEENWSTRVEFEVDPKYFDTLEIASRVVKERLLLVNTYNNNCNIFYCNELIPKLTLETFVRNLLQLDEEIPLFSVQEQKQGETITVFFTYENIGKQSPVVMGDVNLNLCDGTYLTNITTLFYNIVDDFIGENKLSKNDILGQLRLYISLSIINPRFDSQTKNKLVKNVQPVINLVKAKLINIITNHKFFKEHFETLLFTKSKQAAAKVLKAKKTRVSSANPLADCKKTPGDILYILEGDSAGGTLKQIRDPSREAIFPLTGKILNSIDKSIDRAVESKKIKFLLEAIGVDLSKDNQLQYRYNQIKLLADSDEDGKHITTLAAVALWKYAPNLILNRKVNVIFPPLYGATKGTQFIPLYNINETHKYANQGYTITRFKGLGEMNPKQLYEVIYKKPIEYIIEPPRNAQDSEIIIKCLTDTSLKRAICKDERFGLEKILFTLTNTP